MGDNATMRAGFRALADSVRRIPEAFGARSTTVTIRVRTYTASVNATGTTLSTTVDSVVDPRPLVRQMAMGERGYFGGGWSALSGAQATERVYRVGPMTLDYVGGGYTAADLSPATANTKRVTVVLVGDDFTGGTSGEEFRVIEAHADHPFRVELLIARTHQGT